MGQEPNFDEGGSFGRRVPPKFFWLKKKSGGHLSVVAFGSERPLSENIYTFWNVFAEMFSTTFKAFNFFEL